MRDHKIIIALGHFWGTSVSAFINSHILVQEKSNKPEVPFLLEADNWFLFSMKRTVMTPQAKMLCTL